MTDPTLEQAEQQQARLRQAVVRYDDLPSEVTTVAGVDVAYAPAGNGLVAAAALLDAQSLAVRQVATYRGEATFPYIPGLFSFRELPAVVRALEQLAQLPDLIVCDGHGIAHPRRFGLASHLGVATGIPTIGCAKTRLVGTFDAIAEPRGSHASLMDGRETIGRVLRTQTGVNPVFVSIGHKVSLDTASAWVLRLAATYRLPETTRVADHAVRQELKRIAAGDAP